MTTCNTRGVRGLLFAGLLALLLTAPALARTGDYYGPVYTSSGDIQVAQKVLVSEHLLKPGHYTEGRMDDATVDGLRAFQRQHFIPDSGVLDHETMAQLMSHLSAPEVARARAGQTDTGTAAGQGTGSAAATARRMPETASSVPLMAALGTLFMAGGFLLVRYRRS
ncbi:MAG TPA: peptidoglycan-binding domain-containing protein [Candidatus Polarisedimenticolia bacterium]|nr:peptidoglycan-binding domain-containing protein [Candidatus Polarisedimenticolia bacterium]